MIYTCPKCEAEYDSPWAPDLVLQCSCGYEGPARPYTPPMVSVDAKIERNEDGRIKSVTLPGTGWS